MIVGASVVLAACGGAITSTDNAEKNGAPSGAEGTHAIGESSGPSSSPLPGPTPSKACTDPIRAACAPPTDVATVADFLAAAAGLTSAHDATTDSSSGAALRPTGDLRITAELEIDVQLFVQSNPACPVGTPPTPFALDCHETTFAPEKPFHSRNVLVLGDTEHLGTIYPSGVDCIAPAAAPSDGCTRLHVASGTVLRLQRISENFGNSSVVRNYIRIVRACAIPCAASERFCEASSTCFVDGEAHCLLCEGARSAVCACRTTGCASAVDGTKCTFMESPDLGGGFSTCQSGTCGGTP